MMPFQFFVVPIVNGQDAQSELNSFLSSRKILSVDRRWVDQGSISFWSFCVDYAEPNTNAPVTKKGGTVPKVDYRAKLGPENYRLFETLRDWRKAIAVETGVPVYMVFNNDHLSEIVQKRIVTRADLEKLNGVGDGRLDKYGARVLTLLGSLWAPSHEANGTVVGTNPGT